MGFISTTADRIRQFFRQDKEQVALRMAKGTTATGYPSAGYDMLQAYGYDVLSDYLRLEHDLLSRFVDYEEMDDYPEISAALDIFSDDSSQPETQINRTVWVESSDANVQRILDDLLHKTLRIDEEIWEMARTLVKYGNDCEEILVTENGVEGLNFLPPPTVRRIEGPRGELFGFIQDFKGKFGYSPQEFQQILAARAASRAAAVTGEKQGMGGLDRIAALEDWEVVHFRLRGKHRRSLYGYSVLESARWIWKRLMMLEDAALIYRLQRAPERYAFYVDVGDLPPAEALAFVNRVRQGHKKTKYFNPTTGKLDLKFNPISQDEDFFIPSRKGQDGTRIEVLGAPSWQHMDDVEYFRDKLFAAMKVPKAYMGQEQGVARAVLSSEDVRFARTVLRVQRELRNGLAKVCRIHLAALNIDPASVDYDIRMTVPSSIFELSQLEVRNARADLAGRMGQFVSMHWIMSNVFGFSDSDIETILAQQSEDSIRTATNQAKADIAVQKYQQENAPPPPPMPGQEPGAAPPGGAPPPAAPAAPGTPGAVPADGGPTAPEVTPPEQAPTLADTQPQPASPASDAVGRVQRLMAYRNTKYPLTQSRRSSRSNVITEEELFRGANRESEKRALDKLEQLLKNDKALAARLMEVRSLLEEVRTMRRG